MPVPPLAGQTGGAQQHGGASTAIERKLVMDEQTDADTLQRIRTQGVNRVKTQTQMNRDKISFLFKKLMSDKMLLQLLESIVGFQDTHFKLFVGKMRDSKLSFFSIQGCWHCVHNTTLYLIFKNPTDKYLTILMMPIVKYSDYVKPTGNYDRLFIRPDNIRILPGNTVILSSAYDKKGRKYE